MKRRIFLAINIPDEIKQKLFEFQKYWQDLPARWIAPKNIHLTLVFIGYVIEGELAMIRAVVREIAARNSPFELRISRIYLGPPQGPVRMVWAEVEASRELINFQRDLENALFEHPGTGYREKEARPYRSHITLCRFDPRDFQKSGFDKNDSFNTDYSFGVNSIEVMESVLSRAGSEYSIAGSYGLKRKAP